MEKSNKIEAGVILAGASITGVIGQISNTVKAENMQEKVLNFLYKDTLGDLKQINRNEKSTSEKTIAYGLIATITGSVAALVPPTLSILIGAATTFLTFKVVTKFIRKLGESKFKNSDASSVKNLGKIASSVFKSSINFLCDSRPAIEKKYDLKSFKKMIKDSCEKRAQDKEQYDNSQEKINKDLYLTYGLDNHKNKSVKNIKETIESDKEFLLDLFKKYQIKYDDRPKINYDNNDEESKERKKNRRNFNSSLEQLEVLFASGHMQDDAFFNAYSCTLDYRKASKELKNINEGNKINNEKPTENNVAEEFSKKGVVALLYNWSKDNKLLKEDLKTKIEELYRIVSDKYDGWCEKYKEIEKLYKGTDRKVGIFNMPEEGFLKQKFKEFTMAFYDFDHLLKIFKNPEEYPLLVGEFRGTLKDSSTEYSKHFDKLILTVLETNKKESVSHERKNYFNLIENIKKINEDEKIKSKICSDLKNFKEYFEKKCDSLRAEYPSFLSTIDKALSLLSIKDMKKLDKFASQKYSQKDLKELIDDDLDNSENKIILDLIMEDINKPAYRALNYHMNEYSLTQKQKSALYEKNLEPKTVLGLLQDDERHSEINVLYAGKFLIWCKENAANDLLEKVRKTYESGNKKEIRLGKRKVWDKQQNLTKEDLIEFFKKKKCRSCEDFYDLNEGLFMDPYKKDIFLEIILKIIPNDENFNIDKNRLKEVFPFEKDTVKLENQIIRNFLKWCKKHATKDYYRSLRKTYLKKAFGIEEKSYRREDLRYTLEDKSEEDLQSLLEFLEEELESGYSINEKLIYEIRVLEEERRLGLISGKYSKDNLLRLLDNRYTFPHLWQEVVKPIKEHISNKHKGETSFLIEIKTDGVITKLKDWLKNGGIDEEDFNLDSDMSNILWRNIIYKQANNNFIDNINEHLERLAKERRNIVVEKYDKYTKEQFLTILYNEEKYPILYSRIKRYSERVVNNKSVDFSQIKQKICSILEGKEKIKQKGQYIEKIFTQFIKQDPKNKNKSSKKISNNGKVMELREIKFD